MVILIYLIVAYFAVLTLLSLGRLIWLLCVGAALRMAIVIVALWGLVLDVAIWAHREFAKRKRRLV
jgi:hypothetical protein